MAITDVLPSRPQHSSASTTASDSSESLLMENTTCIPCPPTPILKCCCGQADCAFLRHNERQLDGLERDVQTAAQLGQALLIRHENYMADAERERLNMTAMIEKLEADKRSLEVENAKTIKENRGLLNQLEELNNSVSETDEHVKSLTATLLSTQEELQRLMALAARTEQLEQQLTLLEEEQAQLQRTLVTTQEEERSAVQRWKRAERMLADLQDQIERIEREAREERERHVEVVGRLERRRVVERELDSAAGRLKGAAAAKTLGNGKGGSNVVSHFVKEILQDNTNLQYGIVELREMLMASNEEVQNLREQLAIHQPIMEDGQNSNTLRKELGQEPLPVAPQLPQELHVHHHYHAPPVIPEPPTKEKPLPHRRPKKKRHVLTPTLFAPPSIRSYPTAYATMSLTAPSTAAAILSQTSVSIPPVPSTPPLPPQYASKRSSVQSTQTRASSFAPSSVPSSPPSIFDRGFGWGSGGMDSSRPTSPESSVGVGGGLYSPSFAPVGKGGLMRGGPQSAYRCVSSPTVGGCRPGGALVSGSMPGIGLQPHWEEGDADAEAETDRDYDHNIQSSPPQHESHEEQHPDYDTESTDPFSPTPHSTLRRTTSHDSIMSIAALDLAPSSSHHHRHGKNSKLSRPSLLTLRSQAPAIADIGTTSLTATARPVSRRGGYDSRTFTRGLLGTLNPTQEETGSATLPPKPGGTIGEWVWSRWGVSPMKTERKVRVEEEVERPPGVNQPGFIRGFLAAERKAQEEKRLRKRREEKEHGIRPERVDEEGLREALSEE